MINDGVQYVAEKNPECDVIVVDFAGNAADAVGEALGSFADSVGGLFSSWF